MVMLLIRAAEYGAFSQKNDPEHRTTSGGHELPSRLRWTEPSTHGVDPIELDLEGKTALGSGSALPSLCRRNAHTSPGIADCAGTATWNSVGLAVSMADMIALVLTGRFNNLSVTV
jgi:hypothetical protein